MECEALLYPISNGVKEAANSGFAAALRQIAGQVGSPHRRSHKTFRTEPRFRRLGQHLPHLHQRHPLPIWRLAFFDAERHKAQLWIKQQAGGVVIEA